MTDTMTAVRQETNTKKLNLTYIDTQKVHDASWGNQRKQARNTEKFEEMVQDIKERGIDVPLAVRYHPTIEGEYELLAGYGRRDAALKLNLKSIPVLIHDPCDDIQAKLIMAAENLQRQDLCAVDAANIAATMLADLGGDMKALSAKTSWSESRIKKYFQLLRCTEGVQACIDIKQENGFTFTLGHANELSNLPSEMQDKILANVLAKKMPISELKKFIKTHLDRDLNTALFDLKDCNSCKFNRLEQTDLFFESTNTGAVCTNLNCFNEKTQAHFDKRLVDLEAEYGKIIFSSTVTANSTPVSAMVVGKEKFVNECLSCTKHTALLVDSSDNPNELDTVKEHFCLDLPCAQKKDVQLKSSTTHSVIDRQPSPTPSPSKDKTSETNTDNSSNTSQESVPKVTSRVINASKDYLQAQYAQQMREHPSFTFATMLLAVTHLNGKGTADANEVLEWMKLEPQRLSELVQEQIESLISKEVEQDMNYGFDPRRFLLKIGSKTDTDQIAFKNWKPTSEYLETMQLPLIKQLLEQSGFTKAFIERFDDKAYTKLTSMKKSDMIKAILAIEFDWTNYCPDFIKSEAK
ncbi:ParB/RepB/Spo0J family partition protein [Vibrio sp. PNB22_3_1]